MNQDKLIEISIHLPLYYNPDRKGKKKKIEQKKLKITLQEILQKFEAYSLFQGVEGVWMNPEGKVFKDIHNVVFILTQESSDLSDWIISYKAELAKRFKQEEIFIKVTQARRF